MLDLCAGITFTDDFPMDGVSGAGINMAHEAGDRKIGSGVLMSDDQKFLDEVSARAEKATPDSHWPKYFHEYDSDGSPTLRGPYHYWLKFTAKVQAEKIPFGEVKADAEFIAHARTDVDRLIAMVKERDAETATLRTEHEELQNHIGKHGCNVVEFYNNNVQLRKMVEVARLGLKEIFDLDRHPAEAKQILAELDRIAGEGM